jgi:hypothetical protein
MQPVQHLQRFLRDRCLDKVGLQLISPDQKSRHRGKSSEGLAAHRHHTVGDLVFRFWNVSVEWGGALRATGAGDRVGPDDFKSSVALVNKLRGQSAFCSFIDEYGLVLQRACSKGAGAYEQDLIATLQKLWGLNWAPFDSPAGARQKSKLIFAPQVTVFGVSVSEQFYGAVTFKEVTGGLLNRHLILRGIDRPPLQERAPGSWNLPEKPKDELRGLYRPRPGKSISEIMKMKIDDTDKQEDEDDKPFDPMVRMEWGKGAKGIWTGLVEKVAQETDPLQSNLFGRVGEMTIRIATIVAFGRYSLTVDEVDNARG